MFIFDESLKTLLSRSRGLNIPLQKCLDAKLVTVQQVDPAELSPGEFAHSVRQAAEVDGVSMVVVDSLNGYLNAMPDERFLTIQLHELLTFLGHLGVATLLIGAHSGLVGGPMNSPGDASYLADAVILLRYFEARGEVRQAISIVKKRGGEHERTIREFRLETRRHPRGRAVARLPRRADGRAILRESARSRTVMTAADADDVSRSSVACWCWRPPPAMQL